MTIETLTRTWSKMTTAGTMIVITITMSETGWRDASAMIDGKSFRCSHSGLNLLVPQICDGLHIVAAINISRVGNLGLTQAEYDSFRATLADQDAAMASNPTLPVLVSQRASLSMDLSDAFAVASDGAARRFNKYDNGYSSTSKEDASIARAQAALAAFDAAHPEVTVEIEAQRVRDIEQFLASD